jgi:hypothetical protein
VAATSLAPVTAGSPTAAGRGRAKGPVLHPRLVAVVTTLCCVAHLWLAASGHHDAWLAALMVAIVAVCLPCAVHIWRYSKVGALHQVAGAAAAMAGLHTFMLLGAGGAGHSHAGTPPSSAAHADGAGGLLLVIALELGTALLAASLVARLRHRGGS